MGLFGKKEKKEKKVTTVIYSCEGLPFPENTLVAIQADPKERTIEITDVLSQPKQKATLKYEQIQAIEKLSRNEVIEYEKNKSVIGRAVTGGLLLGGLGAIVGGMSGVGSTVKNKMVQNSFLIINYLSSDNEEKAISFSIPQDNLDHRKFIEHIKEKCNISSDNSTIEL